MENNQPNLINELQPFVELFMHYECAMLEIETKLNVFDKEFSLHGESNPIESISTRLKTPMSLMNKLQRLELPLILKRLKRIFMTLLVFVLFAHSEMMSISL